MGIESKSAQSSRGRSARQKAGKNRVMKKHKASRRTSGRVPYDNPSVVRAKRWTDEGEQWEEQRACQAKYSIPTVPNSPVNATAAVRKARRPWEWSAEECEAVLLKALSTSSSPVPSGSSQVSTAEWTSDHEPDTRLARVPRADVQDEPLQTPETCSGELSRAKRTSQSKLWAKRAESRPPRTQTRTCVDSAVEPTKETSKRRHGTKKEYKADGASSPESTAVHDSMVPHEEANQVSCQPAPTIQTTTGIRRRKKGKASGRADLTPRHASGAFTADAVEPESSMPAVEKLCTARHLNRRQKRSSCNDPSAEACRPGQKIESTILRRITNDTRSGTVNGVSAESSARKAKQIRTSRHESTISDAEEESQTEEVKRTDEGIARNNSVSDGVGEVPIDSSSSACCATREGDDDHPLCRQKVYIGAGTRAEVFWDDSKWYRCLVSSLSVDGKRGVLQFLPYKGKSRSCKYSTGLNLAEWARLGHFVPRGTHLEWG